jgi:hypothetical protein
MQLAISRTVTAGVALVGASAIALTPIADTLPGAPLPSMRSAEVQIAAFVNPIDEWVQVIGTSFGNLSALGTQFQSDPLPILGQLLDNQVANIKTLFDAGEQAFGIAGASIAALPQTVFDAVQQAASGHVFDAVQTIIGNVVLPVLVIPVLPLSAALPIIKTAVQNVANVVGVVADNLLVTGLALVAPIIGTANQFGHTADDIIGAVSDGHFDTAISEFINAPATLLNAFVNGTEDTAGVLTPTDGVGGGGPIAALLKFREAVAEALAPAVPEASTAAVALRTSAQATAQTTATRSAAPTKRATTGKSDTRTKAPAAATTADKTGSADVKGGAGTSGSAKSGKSGDKAGSARHRGAA